MKLSQQEVELFYELMWSLQFFVKQKLKLLRKIRTLQEYSDCSQQDKMKVTQKMYENIELIDIFIKENPQNFSDEKLDIVASWKSFISDNFHIERILKKYTIFISSKNDVYAVLALTNDFGELIHKSQLPLYVKAVLLPFKGKILYDGLFERYNIYFGGGTSSDLKEVYLAAKQNVKIKETLDSDITTQPPTKSKENIKDFSPEFDKLTEISNKLRGGSGQPSINSPVFSLIKASIELGQLAVSDPNDIENLWQNLNKVLRFLKKVERILSRAEY
ncbi:MAG: hypothetical protein ABIN18_01335 [Pseudomonadota bacterium]